MHWGKFEIHWIFELITQSYKSDEYYNLFNFLYKNIGNKIMFNPQRKAKISDIMME